MREYPLYDEGYDYNSGSFYNVAAFPLDESSSDVSSELSLQIIVKLLDGGVLRPFRPDYVPSFKINRADSYGGISGIDDVTRWLGEADDFPLSAGITSMDLITDGIAEWPRARIIIVIITINFFAEEDDEPEEEFGGERAAVDVRAAVDALEKVVLRDSETETGIESGCVVCLEEFLAGVEVIKMPCSHVFHGDCIVTWLENRCVCPLCRFEL